LRKLRKLGAGAAVFVAAIVVVAGVPLVPYSISFTSDVSPASPPVPVAGYSTILYRLAGLGSGPYSSVEIVPQGGSASVVHFEGTSISYWEGPFPANAVINPSGVIRVDNVSMIQWAFGLLNFTARLTNLGDLPIYNLTVIFHYPTYGHNVTMGGLTRSFGPTALCSPSLSPSKSCTALVSLPQSASLLTGEDYQLVVEAWSPGPPSSGGAFAAPFVYVETMPLRYQGAGLSPEWVQQFIQAVNEVRNATALTEDTTLDKFAAFRYDSIRAEYQISDFNFTQDYARFFGSNTPVVFEEILYPQGQDPGKFPAFLHQNAPGHWAGLMDSAFTKYGYFFGTGPSVVIGPGCSAKEIPGPDINITQFVISHGCDYVIADQVWLILILGA
jgi:hypothetical protein